MGAGGQCGTVAGLPAGVLSACLLTSADALTPHLPTHPLLPFPQGRPIFAFSTMSPHTADVKANPKCSVTVMADPFRVRGLPWRCCAFGGGTGAGSRGTPAAPHQLPCSAIHLAPTIALAPAARRASRTGASTCSAA